MLAYVRASGFFQYSSVFSPCTQDMAYMDDVPSPWCPSTDFQQPWAVCMWACS
jgi:hypothetical protein